MFANDIELPIREEKSSTTPSYEQTLDLIDAIYAASLDVSLWQSVVEKLGQLTNSHQFGIWAHNEANNGMGYTFDKNIDETMFVPYLEHYIEHDYQRQALQRLPSGKVYDSIELIPEEGLTPKENYFYNEFLVPQDMHYALGSVALKQNNGIVLVSGQRSNKGGPYEEKEKQALQTFIPHIRRAFTINQLMAYNEFHQSVAEEMLNCFNVATLLLNRFGKILALNQPAERLIQAKQGVSSVGRKLKLTSSKETSALHTLIANAADYPNKQGDKSSGTITLKRQLPLTPLTLLVTPTRAQTKIACMDAPTSALVFINENEQKLELSADIIRGLYNLSKAEARLSIEITSGLSIEQISHKLNLSENTLRSQLKSTFVKTNTKRQAELVKLILSGPAGLAIAS
ncbi:helix-turn-helix transcriptional regulator [Pseudomonadota bacterium]